MPICGLRKEKKELVSFNGLLIGVKFQPRIPPFVKACYFPSFFWEPKYCVATDKKTAALLISQC